MRGVILCDKLDELCIILWRNGAPVVLAPIAIGELNRLQVELAHCEIYFPTPIREKYCGWTASNNLQDLNKPFPVKREEWGRVDS